jgi:NADH-quinone oxidoreductase subunit J
LLQAIFLVAGTITLISSVMVVTSPNLVHAALWLVAALAGVAVLFLLLEATFLAVVQVAIYIGAIAILVIFAVMLTRRVMADVGSQINRTWWLAAPAAVVLYAGLVVLISRVPAYGRAAEPLLKEQKTIIADLGRALVDAQGFVLPFELASVLLLAAMIGAIVLALPPTPIEDLGAP